MDDPGAAWSALSYEEQLAKKQRLLTALFQHDVGVTPHPRPTHYRIRLDLVFKDGVLGTHRDDGVVALTESLLVVPRLNQLLPLIRDWVSRHDMRGWLRYVVLRGEDERMVVVTTASIDHKDWVAELASALDVESVVWTVTERDTSIGDVHEVFGESTITITLGDTPFVITPQSFFQASPDSMALAITAMREAVPEGAVLLDAYCGVGTIGLLLRPKVLVGVENNESALVQARKNAAALGINAEYVHGSLSDAPRMDYAVVVVDPPRTGLMSDVFTLLSMRPEMIVYLSCNPSTQRRDLAVLSSEYVVESVHGFDFFPQTPHVECLVVLRRVHSSGMSKTVSSTPKAKSR